MADIFVSYTSSDRDWAFWVAKELQALAHVPHVHEWEIKGGDDIYAWMEQRHDAADHVLCVVSDDYLKAPYSTLERNAALWQAAAKRPGFVLLVAVRPCRLPTLSDHVRRCELFGIPEDAARLRLREFMQKREAPATAAFPGKVFAVSNIPIRVPEHFLGREGSLAAIETALSRYEGRVAITALHGLRGVGKTTLAAAYAERHRGDYRATWWIRAQTADGVRADLVGLGVRLGWVAADENGRVAERPAAEALSQALGGLPLAHEQAAAYCERLEVPLAEYLRRFDAAPARMLDTARDAPAEYHDRLTVAKTFALAIDEAARLHPGAEPLIVHAALLAPDPYRCFCLPRRGRNSARRSPSRSKARASTKPWRRCAPSPWSTASRSPTSAIRHSRPIASGCTAWCGRWRRPGARVRGARRRGARWSRLSRLSIQRASSMIQPFGHGHAAWMPLHSRWSETPQPCRGE